MLMSIREYESFDQFARNQFALHSPRSIDDLVEQWKREREADETVADVKQALKEIDEGKSLPLDEAFREIRKSLGWEK